MKQSQQVYDVEQDMNRSLKTCVTALNDRVGALDTFCVRKWNWSWPNSLFEAERLF
jgi:hypothetical protein